MSDTGRPPASKSAPPPPFGAADPAEKDHERKRYFERVLPEVIRRVMERALETGVEKISEAPENLREMVGDLKVGREAAGYLYDQIDDTKKGVYRVVAKEIRDVLEHMNFADEMANVLTKLSFEINTTIRFVPNKGDADDDADAADDANTEGDKRPSRYPRPKVTSRVAVKPVEKPKHPPDHRTRADGADDPAEESHDES